MYIHWGYKKKYGSTTVTNVTYNSSDVIVYQRQHTTATQHDLKIRVNDDTGFVSSFFESTIANLQWIINNWPRLINCAWNVCYKIYLFFLNFKTYFLKKIFANCVKYNYES